MSRWPLISHAPGPPWKAAIIRSLLLLMLIPSTFSDTVSFRDPRQGSVQYPYGISHKGAVQYDYGEALAASKTSLHHAKCFSCMSRLYESVWPILQNIYRRPKNFTEACDDIENHHDFVQYDFCPTICISMAEELNIGGVVIRGHIRGCKDNILLKGKEGFNRTIVERYRWLKRDSCNLYPKKELLELPGNYADHSKIQVCTCYDDHCNGSSAGSTIISSFPGFIVLLVLACLRL